MSDINDLWQYVLDEYECCVTAVQTIEQCIDSSELKGAQGALDNLTDHHNEMLTRIEKEMGSLSKEVAAYELLRLHTAAAISKSVLDTIQKFRRVLGR